MAKSGLDIESAVKVFIGIFNARMHVLNKDDPSFPADVTAHMSPNKVSIKRTPEQQAAEVQKNKSWTCRSSHMHDDARHIIVKVGKTAYYGLSEIKPLKKHQETFKKVWSEALAVAMLRNYHGTNGYAPGDEFHVELPESKLPPGDKRVKACYLEYVRLTRQKGKKQNPTFEKGAKSEIESAVRKLGLGQASS